MRDTLAATAVLYLFLLACLFGVAAAITVWVHRRAAARLGICCAALFALAFAIGWMAGV